MSGGSYNYAFQKVDDFISELETTGNEDISKLRLAFAKHLQKVSAAMKAIEWVDSGDYGLGDEVEDIKACLPDLARLSALQEAREVIQVGYERQMLASANPNESDEHRVKQAYAALELENLRDKIDFLIKEGRE